MSLQEKLVNIKLSDIEANPNRDLIFNPYNEAKIVALMSSIGETGFWSNVIVRPHPTKKGKYQQSYGHHRTEAARRSGIKEADFVVRDLDENMMLKMMELENQEDYRYCPLSLLESVKAVVQALAVGRIAPFYHVEDGTLPPEGDPERFKGASRKGGKWVAQAWIKQEGQNQQRYLGTFDDQLEAAKAYREAVKGSIVTVGDVDFRYAPSFVPSRTGATKGTAAYVAKDIAKFLGRATKNREDVRADAQTCAALDALYLLEVKAITTAKIKDMNWSQLGRFVADAKAERERNILRKVKTAEEIKKLNAEALRIQEERRDKEKKIADERAALVKKEVEAKREEDAKKSKAIKERIADKDAEAEEVAETFEIKEAAIEAKVEEVKQKQVEEKKEDVYLPTRRETERIVHILERRDEEEAVKALARKDIKPSERERLRQAAIAKGTWYLDWVAQLFLPPLSTKNNMGEYRRREESQRLADAAKIAKENK